MSTQRFVLLVAGLTSAVASAQWDWAGTDGAFGSAKEACEDMIGKSAYVFGDLKPVENEEQKKAGYQACYSKYGGGGEGDKKDKKEPELIYVGLVYPVEKAPQEKTGNDDKGASANGGGSDAGAASSNNGSPPKCGSKTDFSWFPTAAKSPLAAAGTGMVPDTKKGSCSGRTVSAGSKLFATSKGAVRADRLKKSSKPVGEHYYLRHEDLLIDPTIFQFFKTESGFSGLVFVGSQAQLQDTLQRLYDLCGPNPETTDGKSGAEIFAADFANPDICNPGSTLQMKPSGKQAFYKDEPYCAH